MTTETEPDIDIGGIVFPPEEEAILLVPPCFSPLFSPEKSQPPMAYDDEKNNNERCESPGCFSLSGFDWGTNSDSDDPATATAGAGAAIAVQQQQQVESETTSADRPIFPSPSTSVVNSSFCPQGADPSWSWGMQPALQKNNPPLPSFQSAHLLPTQAPGLNFAVPESSGMMSSLQPFQDSYTATQMKLHSPLTETETIQTHQALQKALQKAQADYAAMLQQLVSTGGAATLPSPDANVQSVNLSYLNVAPLSLNNMAYSPSTFVFSSSSGNQQLRQVQVQHDLVQSQMMQGGPQYSPHLNGYDPNQQFHSGILTSGGIGSGNKNIVDPVTNSNHPTTLSIPSDEEFLDPVYHFLRTSFIEVFVCRDINSGRGRGASSHAIGQVGLRCLHCKNIERNKRANQAESYPSKTTNIFESVRNYQRKHLQACEHIPGELKTQYRNIMMSNPYRKVRTKYVKVYFAEAACELGMVETPRGLFFGAPPNTSGTPSQKLQAIMSIAGNPTALKNKHLNEVLFPKVDERLENCKFYHIASINTRQVIDNCRKEKAAFVYPSDFPTVSDFRFVLYHQFLPCRPSTATVSRRKAKPDKWDTLSGLYCKHCANAHPGGHYLEGMYFPLDFESLHDTSFSQHLYCHIMTCPYAPLETKEALDELQALAAEHGSITKRGAKKKFLEKVWDRVSNYYS